MAEKHNVSMMASEQIGPESQNTTQQRITIGTVLDITVSNGTVARKDIQKEFVDMVRMYSVTDVMN